ncbi:MAG TPA: CHAT domain-containing protein, partial [Planctomycetota bacterium]|nr:CHAT domain-containing protein [Planctomycetota bacterium]
LDAIAGWVDAPTERVHASELAPVGEALLRLYADPSGWSAALSEIGALSGFRRHAMALGTQSYAAQVDYAVGVSLLQQSNYGTFDELLAGALEAYTARDLGRARLLTLVADGNRARERWQISRSALLESRAILDELSGPEEDPNRSLVECEWSIVAARVDVHLGRPERAAGHIEEARERVAGFLERASPDWLPFAQGLASQIASERRDLLLLMCLERAAIDELESELTSGEEPTASARLQLGIAHAYLEIDDPDHPPRARELLSRAAEDTQLDAAARILARQLAAELDLAQGRLEGARERLRATASALGELRDVTHLRVRQVVLESMLARASGANREDLLACREALEQADALVRESWSRTPLDRDGVGFLQHSQRSETYAERLRLERSLGEPELALAAVVRAQALGSLGRRLEVAVPSLDEVREALVGDGGLAVYVPSGFGVELVLLDAAGLEQHTLESERVLMRRLEDWRAAGLSGAPFRAELAALGTALLPEPARARISGWSHVYLVGAEFLPAAPFERLPWGDASLGARIALARLPSIPVGVHLARRPRALGPARGESLRLVAAPRTAHAVRARWPYVEDFELSEADVALLLAPFPGSRPRLADAATKGALAAPDAELLHVICHGVLDDERTPPAVLLLSPAAPGDDGLVDAAAIESLRVPGMVLLSACGTARSRARRGEDSSVHLGGAFLGAGARAVLVAQQDVELRSALMVAREVHESLARGLGLAAALQRAHAAWLETESGPFPDFVALGLAHLPTFAEPENATRAATSAWVGLGVGLLALLLGLGFVRRQRRA